jgi:capsular polysaccharide biosynthesis protein
MDIERLGMVFRRRLGLIAVIVLLTAIVSAVYPLLHPSGWQITTQLLVNPIAGDSGPNPQYYDRAYYQELTSEYILDDFSAVITQNSFSQDIIAKLKQSPDPAVRAAAGGLDANSLSTQFTVKRIHRVLQVQIDAPSKQLGMAIAQATDELIAQKGPDYFQTLDPTNAKLAGTGQPVASVAVTDAPHVTQQPGLAKDTLFWLLRTVVGLAAALAIAFILHYVDDRLYDEYDVRTTLGLPLLGTVEAPPLAPGSARAAPTAARAPVTA